MSDTCHRLACFRVGDKLEEEKLRTSYLRLFEVCSLEQNQMMQTSIMTVKRELFMY